MKLEKYIVNSDENLERVISKIILNSKRTVLVISKKKIIGTISEGDVLRSLLQNKNLSSPAKNIMNKSFKYVKSNYSNKDIKNIFVKFNINILPVLDKKFRLKRIITLKDIINKK